ncbi:uncharacterized protein RSE6_08511 [Rhynchosporium secalis]|uniref:Uncharacterized protein n=1 Tax=Rhynchosporium secalis TaxID=38038 RepID=A0A1E1MFL1_RHYSE|nr:uncharacterized protein RSE6_08511 [Rhynchosporium secalis]
MASTLTGQRPSTLIDSLSPTDHATAINEFASRLKYYPKLPAINDPLFPQALLAFGNLISKLYHLIRMARSEAIAGASSARVSVNSNLVQGAMPVQRSDASLRSQEEDAQRQIALVQRQEELLQQQAEQIRSRDHVIQQQGQRIQKLTNENVQLGKRLYSLDAQANGWQLV